MTPKKLNEKKKIVKLYDPRQLPVTKDRHRKI